VRYKNQTGIEANPPYICSTARSLCPYIRDPDIPIKRRTTDGGLEKQSKQGHATLE